MSSDNGTIIVTGDVALIAFERRLRHPVETVWAALADPEERAAWLGPGMLDHRVGGEVAISTGPATPNHQRVMTGRVLAWDPPRVLEHEWLQPGIATSVVRYELEPVTSGTILRLTHRRSVSPAATGGRAGWHAYLDRLTAHLDGMPVPEWAERRAEVQDLYGEPPIPGTPQT